jgi:putative oxidoreductase
MFKSDDTGKLVLRLALGILILLHGVAKVTKGVDGVGGVGGMLASHGLPAFLAYAVYVGEILAPVLLIVGLFTRPAAVIVAINMLVAIWLVHRKDLGALNGQGGWALELQGMFLFAAISLAFTGGGRFGLSNK